MSADLRHLPTLVSIWSRLRSELAEAHGLDEGDDVLVDTIDGIADLGDQMHALLRHAVEQEMFAAALESQIVKLQARRNRLNKSAQTIRQHVAEAGIEAGIKRLDRPDMTVSFRIGPPSLVGSVDPYQLPDDLVRIKREVNRAAIKALIEAGDDVPGFSMSNGRPVLTVRQS